MTGSDEDWSALMRAANAGDTRAYARLLHAITPVLRGIVRAKARGFPPEAQEEYLREGAVPITADEEALAALGVTVRYAPVALWQKALVRHDPAALAAALRDLYREASPTRIYG